MQVFYSICLLLSFHSIVIAKYHSQQNNYKLQQLQVLFRHGDRTPVIQDSYDNDPYNEIWQKYGYGQLTKIGKNRAYKIGKILRNRYDAFLGEYRAENVYSYSTDADRTKMSLQLVLAGLYPPTPSTWWSKSLNWQPIPTYYEASNVSFLSSIYFCPRYIELYNHIDTDPDLYDIFERHRYLFQRIANNTGVEISTILATQSMYFNLYCALSFGLPLPSWCSQEDFHELETINTLAFKAMTRTEQLRRMIAGPLVEKFSKILYGNEMSTKKIHLYSGSDYNIATFINAHNISGAPDIPNFGSALILEKLRGPDDRKYLRMLLWTGVSERLIILNVKNCGVLCPLSEYQKILRQILPIEACKICK